jgi:hypothetical protein
LPTPTVFGNEHTQLFWLWWRNEDEQQGEERAEQEAEEERYQQGLLALRCFPRFVDGLSSSFVVWLTMIGIPSPCPTSEVEVKEYADDCGYQERHGSQRQQNPIRRGKRRFLGKAHAASERGKRETDDPIGLLPIELELRWQ